MRKCIYCKKEVDENSVIDFCPKCGIGVWGEKMFYAIVKNMEEARDKGDLCATNMNGGVDKTPSNVQTQEPTQTSMENTGFSL